MKKLLLALLCLLCFSPPVSAYSLDTSDLERAVPDGVLDGVTPGNADLETGMAGLLSRAARLFSGSLGEGLRAALGITLIAALCAAAESLTGGVPARHIQLAGVLGIAALTVTGMNSLLAAGREAVGRLDTFSKALLPSLAAAAAASGKPASAFFRQAGTAAAANILTALYDRLLYPLLYIYAALITFDAALPRGTVRRIAGLCKWVFTGALTMTLTLFTAYLAVGGAVSGQADAAAVKTAKAALSGMLPVVGGIIGDASETVLSGASVVKNAVGIFGLLAVLGIVLSPLASIAVRFAAMKLGAALAGAVGGEALARYADDLSALFSMMLGLISAAAFLLLISIISCIMAGGA